MKKALVFLCLITSFITLSSSTQKNAPAEVFIVFSGPDGTEITKNANEANYADWSQPDMRLEFRIADHAVPLKGLFVFVPGETDPLVRVFTGNEELTRCFQETRTGSGPETVRRIIISNIRDPKTNITYSPLIYTLHGCG